MELNGMVDILAAILFYPGIIFIIVLGIVAQLVQQWASPGTVATPIVVRDILPAMRAGTALEGGMALLSILASGLAMALMPFPYHPLGQIENAWVWAWGAIECAFLLPLLPALGSGWPPIVRAAIREAQMGMIGRVAVWLALATLFLLPSHHPMIINHYGVQALLPAYVLLLIGFGTALPVACGWGPFSNETTITPGGTIAHLDPPIQSLDGVARAVRTTALLSMGLLGFVASVPLPAWSIGLLVIALVLLIAIVAGRVEGMIPRFTLLGAVHHCLLRAFPASATVLIYCSLL